MAENILHQILQTKRKEVGELLERQSLADLRALAAAAPPARNFFQAVTKKPRRLVNLIAEVKKASPSAGVIREDFDPVAIARQYAAAGADAISVLTDEQYFQGSLDYLRAVRAAVDLPVLRKDFLIDASQLYQSRAAGADAVLLIAAAMPVGQLMDLMILATELRMSVLVEVHGADELLNVRSMIGFPHRAYSLLGVNNRDLTTFKVDINTTIRLAQLACDERTIHSADCPLVSESGIKTLTDVQRLAAAGVKAILVGETLMRASDVGAAVEELLGPAK
jgi:indole-3-glycerol phosphate synthase